MRSCRVKTSHPAVSSTDFGFRSRKPGFWRSRSGRAPARLLARRSSPERGSSHFIATNERPMASTRGRRAHEEPLARIERRQVSKARGRWLVLRACCRGVSAAGETPSLLAVQCREPVIADGQPGGGLIVSAQLPSSWEHRPGWTTWSEHGVIKRCDGSDDPRLWYSFVGSEVESARDPARGSEPGGWSAGAIAQEQPAPPGRRAVLRLETTPVSAPHDAPRHPLRPPPGDLPRGRPVPRDLPARRCGRCADGLAECRRSTSTSPSCAYICAPI